MGPTRAGEKTRATILREAAQLATLEGLEGLSIGHLAAASGMSKSGLYAHFGSKEELQLATIESARQTFVEEVLRPGLAEPKGVRRLIGVCDAFLAHLERRVFPGGCFFAAATAAVGARRDRVRDAVADQQKDWLEVLARLAREAQELGQLDPGVDPAQLAFEVHALVLGANGLFILTGDPSVLDRARAGVRSRVLTGRPESRP